SQIADVLRWARQASGFTRHDVAAAMDWSPSKLTRIENGRSYIGFNDIRALLDLYDRPSRATGRLDAISQPSRTTGLRPSAGTDGAADRILVYLDTNDPGLVNSVLSALRDILNGEGLALEQSAEPEISSWFGRFRVGARKVVTGQE